MNIEPFKTEHFYARYEFSAPYLLSVSDCETVTLEKLLDMANMSLEQLGALKLGYTESQGHPKLRAAIADAYERVSSDHVVVLNSPVEGIYLTMRTLLEPGDEAIVLIPAYDSLYNMAKHICDQVHPWKLLPTDKGWQLDLEALKRMLNTNTKLIVVNFPHNPTGFLPTRDTFETLIELARRHDAWLFCDEMYRGLEREADQRLTSAADRYERSVVLSGLSKAHGLAGLRSGWLVISDEGVRKKLINWKYYTTICPPAPSEFLALAALKAQEQLIARNRERIEHNLSIANPFFERWKGFFTWRPPQAGSTALVKIDVPSATDYCHQLAQTAGVVLLPSHFMGYEDRYVRFGFGRDTFSDALQQYEAHLEAQRV